MNQHALQRAMERYGLNLLASDLDALAERIRNGESVLCERKPDGAETRLAEIGLVPVRVVWSPEQARVITFLPLRKVRNDLPRRKVPKGKSKLKTA